MKDEIKGNDGLVDIETARYYSARAAALAEEYGKASPGYTAYCSNRSGKRLRLLDIGCGTGRDLAVFQKAGFDVTGADVSKEMLEQAAVKYGLPEDKLICTGLPELSGINGGFDTILCSGVMQHIENRFLNESLKSIAGLLDDKGIFIFSFPVEYPDIDPETERDKNGRLFIIRSEEKYRLLLERLGLKNIRSEIHSDSLNRSSTSWAVHVYEKTERYS